MVDTGLAKLGYEYVNLGNRFAFLALFGFRPFQLFMFRNEAYVNSGTPGLGSFCSLSTPLNLYDYDTMDGPYFCNSIGV